MTLLVAVLNREARSTCVATARQPWPAATAASRRAPRPPPAPPAPQVRVVKRSGVAGIGFSDPPFGAGVLVSSLTVRGAMVGSWWGRGGVVVGSRWGRGGVVVGSWWGLRPGRNAG